MQKLSALGLVLVWGCTTAEPDPPDEPPPERASLDGVYQVDAVTCDGQEEAISVVATVTFDDGSYLEQWDFPNSDCELSLSGTAIVVDAQLTLEGVEISCTGTCPPNICDDECSVDQVYAVAHDDDELLLSFTQRGDEFGCGPCGDGVASTYLLVESPE